MFTKRKAFEYGGIAASIVLIAFGIAAIVLVIIATTIILTLGFTRPLLYRRRI